MFTLISGQQDKPENQCDDDSLLDVIFAMLVMTSVDASERSIDPACHHRFLITRMHAAAWCVVAVVDPRGSAKTQATSGDRSLKKSNLRYQAYDTQRSIETRVFFLAIGVVWCWFDWIGLIWFFAHGEYKFELLGYFFVF